MINTLSDDLYVTEPNGFYKDPKEIVKGNEETAEKVLTLFQSILEIQKTFNNALSKGKDEYISSIVELFAGFNDKLTFSADARDFILTLKYVIDYKQSSIEEKIKDLEEAIQNSKNSKQEQIQRKLETLINEFINKRKQQWQKRTM